MGILDPMNPSPDPPPPTPSPPPSTPTPGETESLAVGASGGETRREEQQEEQREVRNPALEFIESRLQAAEVTSEGPAVKTRYLFQLYRDWCEENNLRPLGQPLFGKEVHRRFTGSQRVRRRDGGGGVRVYVYVGIDYQEGVVNYSDRDEAYTNPNGGF